MATLTVALVLGAIIGTPVVAYELLRKTVNIYTVNQLDTCDLGNGQQPCDTVSTFDDRGNKCYVLKTRSNIGAASISCVKQGSSNL